jgi:uncharacterized protein (DUF2236 family)
VPGWGHEKRHAQVRQRSHSERLASRDGYFPPESVIRRVGNSPLVPLLGGGAAVLLQVAHPLVAAGVTEHSDYRSDLWRRLLRTLNALYLIVYGSKDEADRAGQAVQAVHSGVRGCTRTSLGPFPAGTHYSASDPPLMLWVHGTLVETSLRLYSRFVRRLSPEQQEAYYREMAVVAEIFGTPVDVIPRDLREFRAYFAERIASPEICVTPPAHEVADVILRAPSLPTPLRAIAPAHRLSTAALLPRCLREEYGLSWNGKRALALRAGARSIRLAAAPLVMVAAHLSPTSSPF